MLTVLIVYEGIPDYLKIYKVKVTSEEFLKLNECHNKYINSDEFDDSFLQEVLERTDGSCVNLFDNTDADSNTAKSAIPIHEEIHAVIVTGFIL